MEPSDKPNSGESVKALLGKVLNMNVDLSGRIVPVLNNVKDPGAVRWLLTDLVCTAVLPASYKGVKFPGHDVTILFLDTDHKLKIDDISEELQTRVRKVAEQHFRTLDKQDRDKLRLTSKDQWQVVKKSLERFLVLQIFNPETFEISLSGLRRLLNANGNISLVIINSINTFFHQVSYETGMYSGGYLRRLLVHLVDSCSGHQANNIHCLYTQHNLFNREDTFYDQIKCTDKLKTLKDPVILTPEDCDTEKKFAVKYKDQKIIKTF